MKLPVYITKDEVKRVCRELKISDWTKKIKDYYARLAQARIALRKSELNRIG
jgi:hypothetical protein